MRFFQDVFSPYDWLVATPLVRRLSRHTSSSRHLEVVVVPEPSPSGQVFFDDWLIKVQRHLADFGQAHPGFPLHVRTQVRRSSYYDTPESVDTVVSIVATFGPYRDYTLAQLRLFCVLLDDLQLVARRCGDTWYAMAEAGINSSSTLHGLTTSDGQRYHQDPVDPARLLL